MAESYHVRIIPSALADLESIFNYIEADSPQNARTMIRRLVSAIDGLEYLPGRHRIVGNSRQNAGSIHACIVRPFIIYYRLDLSTRAVFVIEVRHGAQQQPRRFD